MNMIPLAMETEPLGGRFVAIIVSLMSTTALTAFLTQRFLAIRCWNRVPMVIWFVFAIYVDSYIFVVASALLQNTLGVNHNIKTCDSAILICLICYVTTKFIYLFLVEKAHIIRGTHKKRSRSKLYLFNSVAMVGVYSSIVILNFVFRIARLEKGECIIGMETMAMIPLISFDALVNSYLTIMFIIPLRQLYSYQHSPCSPGKPKLRSVAFRTFVGAVCALISSITNLSVLMSLDGEPGWLCLMCCNCDILFSAVVIQWVTSKDNAATSAATSSTGYFNGRNSQGLSSSRGPTSGAGTSPESSISRDPVSMPLSKISRRKSTPSDMQDSHSGVMITTTIHIETRPESTAQLAIVSGDDRKQDSHTEAEEGRVEIGSPSRYRELSGSRTSIIASHDD